MVADVEYESWAEELRLWGGEATLMRPSEFRTLLLLRMDLLSPPPFNMLGAPPADWLILGIAVTFRDFRAGVAPPASGLGGRLDMRESPFGGWGKEFMLTTLRMDLPLGVLGVGSAEVGGAVGGGRWVLDGA